jgi:hypothetical protein
MAKHRSIVSKTNFHAVSCQHVTQGTLTESMKNGCTLSPHAANPTRTLEKENSKSFFISKENIYDLIREANSRRAGKKTKNKRVRADEIH